MEAASNRSSSASRGMRLTDWGTAGQYIRIETAFQNTRTVEHLEYPSNTTCNVDYHTVMFSRAISCVSVELVCDVSESVLEFTEPINTDILWRIDPLLSGDSVNSNRFWAAAR
jgi:hypothetical protein